MTLHIETFHWSRPRLYILAAVLIAWAGIAFYIGNERLLAGGGPSFFQPIALTAIIPVTAFILGYIVSPAVRRFVLTQDLKILTMLHQWRVVGFVFLPLFAFGVLPGLFAWPAGLGDVAVGITALFVVIQINRNADFITSGRFLAFHYLGLLDFAVAISTAALAGGVIPDLVSSGVTSAPLEVWPLNIFPSFIVPAFIIVQLSAILKAHHLRKTARIATNAAFQTA